MNWKECPGFPDYEVSEFGDIRRSVDCGTWKSGRLLSPYFQTGYKKYTLRVAGKPVNVLAHRMVAAAFISPPPFEEAEACHNDGDRAHNHYSNLRWDTAFGNRADMVRHGTARSCLEPSQVIEIRARLSAGHRLCEIAPEYGVDAGTIAKIKRRETWAHLE